MQTLKNVTEGIHPFQQALYQKVMAGGFQRGELLFIRAGRNTGKSTLNQYYSKLWNNNLCNEILLPMKAEPKHKFSRARWYVAQYNLKDYNKVMDWCDEYFGPHPAQPDAWSRWIDKGGWPGKVHFRDERDYLMFVLRWS